VITALSSADVSDASDDDGDVVPPPSKRPALDYRGKPSWFITARGRVIVLEAQYHIERVPLFSSCKVMCVLPAKKGIAKSKAIVGSSI